MMMRRRLDGDVGKEHTTAEKAWPQQPFYLQSCVGNLNYGLTFWQRDVGGGVIDNIGPRPLVPGTSFLWKALPDPRGGAFLMHCGTGYFLTRVNGDRQLRLGPMESGNPNQLWVADDLGGLKVNIHPMIDWGLGVDVNYSDLNGRTCLYGSHSGVNQQWLAIPESGTVEVLSVQYDVVNAVKNFTDPPSKMAYTTVRNPSPSSKLSISKKLVRTITNSHTITFDASETRTQTYTQTFGVKTGAGSLWEVNAEFKFEQSTSKTLSWSNSTTESQTNTEEVAISADVSAGKTWTAQILVFYARFRIPFTATLLFRSSLPGSPTEILTTRGNYDGVNGVRTDIEVLEG